MNNTSLPTQTPNKNVLTFPAGATAASSNALVIDDAFTSADMPAD